MWTSNDHKELRLYGIIILVICILSAISGCWCRRHGWIPDFEQIIISKLKEAIN